MSRYIVSISNPTDKDIETAVVRNGLWAGWGYEGYAASEEEIAQMESDGATVEYIYTIVD